jgi:hypothetical protein
MHKGASITQMVQKMLISFTNITVFIILHILGDTFCVEHHILVHFLPNAVAINVVNELKVA